MQGNVSFKLYLFLKIVFLFLFVYSIFMIITFIFGGWVLSPLRVSIYGEVFEKTVHYEGDNKRRVKISELIFPEHLRTEK